MATFEKCEIFSNLYFSYVRYYKATLSGGNQKKSCAMLCSVTGEIWASNTMEHELESGFTIEPWLSRVIMASHYTKVSNTCNLL